ncbi:MAG TPA: 2-hydroxychromene-2-carboxylate isomerase [Candidatus Binataceae bacterium]|nr:2-hydroxychromene-2-carboxylate isomerase [Candidatus Binataceae bacterium]
MKTVDFFFDYSSTNSYFAAFMLPEICRKHDALVNWLPIHSAALFRGTGFDVMAMTPRKARYLWRDHQRYAEFTGLPFRKPSRFPIKTSAALRATLMMPGLAGENPDNYTASVMGEFAQAVMRAYWERDVDIADIAALGSIGETIGIKSERLSAAANSADARARLAKVTEDAIARGVFGAPMFFLDGEMFWGKDRLDFVERLLTRR